MPRSGFSFGQFQHRQKIMCCFRPASVLLAPVLYFSFPHTKPTLQNYSPSDFSQGFSLPSPCYKGFIMPFTKQMETSWPGFQDPLENPTILQKSK